MLPSLSYATTTRQKSNFPKQSYFPMPEVRRARAMLAFLRFASHTRVL